MVRAADIRDVVFRRVNRTGLEQFLQSTLWIVQSGNDGRCLEMGLEMTKHKCARDFVASVQIYCAQQCLECIRQDRRTIAPALRLLATAQNQMLTQPEPARLFGQKTAVGQSCSRPRHRPFGKSRIPSVQLTRQHQLQNSIAQKLKPLIVSRTRALVRDGTWVRESRSQQFVVAKLAACDLPQ